MCRNVRLYKYAENWLCNAETKVTLIQRSLDTAESARLYVCNDCFTSPLSSALTAAERWLCNAETKVALIQRSCGYALRPTLDIAEIEMAVQVIKAQNPDCIVAVDNCYGEFTATEEPCAVSQLPCLFGPALCCKSSALPVWPCPILAHHILSIVGLLPNTSWYPLMHTNTRYALLIFLLDLSQQGSQTSNVLFSQ